MCRKAQHSMAQHASCCWFAVYGSQHQYVYFHWLQAFQLSEQAVTLFKDGWFCPESEPSGVSKMQNPKEAKVEQPLIVVSEYRTCSCPPWLLYAVVPTTAAIDEPTDAQFSSRPAQHTSCRTNPPPVAVPAALLNSLPATLHVPVSSGTPADKNTCTCRIRLHWSVLGSLRCCSD